MRFHDQMAIRLGDVQISAGDRFGPGRADDAEMATASEHFRQMRAGFGGVDYRQHCGLKSRGQSGKNVAQALNPARGTAKHNDLAHVCFSHAISPDALG